MRFPVPLEYLQCACVAIPKIFLKVRCHTNCDIWYCKTDKFWLKYRALVSRGSCLGKQAPAYWGVWSTLPTLVFILWRFRHLGVVRGLVGKAWWCQAVRTGQIFCGVCLMRGLVG